MRTMWQRLRSPAGLAIAGLAAGALVTLLLVAAWVWWRHDDRPWPVLVWFALKALVASKGVVKLAVAALLGVAIAWRALVARARNRRAAAAPDPESADAESTGAGPAAAPVRSWAVDSGPVDDAASWPAAPGTDAAVEQDRMAKDEVRA